MLKKVLTALRRPASSGSIILEIEGLRFIAIISVLSLHMGTQILRVQPALQTSGDWLYWTTINGGLGVNLFFSISGFILGYPFARHYLMGKPKMPVHQFYFKRLTRLEPPFIINITLFLLVQVFLMHETITALLPHYFATLTYTHWFIYGIWSNINPVTWSLETEIQFYLLAPLIFWGLYSIGKRYVRIILLAVLMAGTVIANSVLGPWYREWHLSKSLIVNLDYFLTGLLFLEIYLWPGFKEKIKRSYGYDALMLFGIVGFFEISYRIPYLSGGLLGDICVICMFLGVFKGRLSNALFTKSIITTIGGMCYTIYLYHYAIFRSLSIYTAKIPVHSNLFWVHYILQGIFLVAAVLIVCSLLFYLFEKPFMVKNWFKSRTVVKATGSAALQKK